VDVLIDTAFTKKKNENCSSPSSNISNYSLSSKDSFFSSSRIDDTVANVPFSVARCVEWGNLKITKLELFLVLADVVDFRNSSVCTIYCQAWLFCCNWIDEIYIFSMTRCLQMNSLIRSIPTSSMFPPEWS
jgi:hypothetical protein